MKKSILRFLLVAFMLIFIIGCNNTVNKINDTTTQKRNSNKNTISLPSFKGEVVELTNDRISPLDIPMEKWLKAKKALSGKHPNLADTITKLALVDFRIIEAWQGTLNGKKFQFDLYTLQANFLLIVSQHGNSEIRVDLSPNPPMHVFGFYGENIRLSILAKGVGKSFNIVSGKFVSDSIPDETFNKIFVELTKISPGNRQIGSNLKIAGHNIKVVGENVVLVK